jgi:DNA polymerase-3 subunit epsilon
MSITIDLSCPPKADEILEIRNWLALGRYHLIRPLQKRLTYTDASPPEKLITVAIVDVETTGRDFEVDQIIELGIVSVEICPSTGQAFRVNEILNELEYPGMPIPPEATRIHHISDEMVAGKRIDDAVVSEVIADVSLVIAHNAVFDRRFVEKRFPQFCSKAWACSLTQIPWSDEGIPSAKLEYLAYSYGFHYSGHRATTDCYALLEVLQQPLPISERKAMQVLLENARRVEIQVSALGSPFECKDILKGRGYRWSGERRVWSKGVSNDELEDEVEWLKNSVYDGRSFKLELEKRTPMNRFSARRGVVSLRQYERQAK